MLLQLLAKVLPVRLRLFSAPKAAFVVAPRTSDDLQQPARKYDRICTQHTCADFAALKLLLFLESWFLGRRFPSRDARGEEHNSRTTALGGSYVHSFNNDDENGALSI